MTPVKVTKRVRRKHKSKMRRRENKRLCIVYGLYDESLNLRYVGQTRMLISDRSAWFFKGISRKKEQSRRLSPVEVWIDSGAKFSIHAIDDRGTWDVSEIIHIERARQRGDKLLNVLRGGGDTVHDLKR